jgi:peptidoglycan L-alanyl-D-glutamate endopeptidase CwlK
MPRYGTSSARKLATCSKEVQALFNEVIKHVDCTIVSGLRSTEEQQILYAQGRTMPGPIVTNLDGIEKRSRHQINNQGICTAVDAVPYPIDWDDRDRFYHFAGVVRGIATQMGLTVTWGGDWDSDYVLDDQSFYDLPHFEVEGVVR